MRILADENVPEEYMFALRGGEHTVIYSRTVDELGPEAADEGSARYAERHVLALLSTDVKDFGDMEADVPVLVAPQDMSGAAVRRAVDRLESIAFDPAESDPIWLSAL